MPLATLNGNDVAVIERALRALAAGEIVAEFEFGGRIGVELADFRKMLDRWPAWMTRTTGPPSVWQSTTHSTIFFTGSVYRSDTVVSYLELVETNYSVCIGPGPVHEVGLPQV